MKIKYLKFKNWLYMSMATLLGINLSCIGASEYGTPSANYRVKGTVTNEQGDPVEGVQVSLKWDETLTDNKGKYAVEVNTFPGEFSSFKLSFKDIDSTENGLYADTTMPVSFQNVPLQGGDGHWFEGTATVRQDMTLREKK